LDTQRIVSELKRERDRLSQAIALLEGSDAKPGPKPGRRAASISTGRASAKRRHLTPEGRKRLSDLMKKRWADRKRKRVQPRKPSAKAA
jgi:hypothetical protein